MGNTKSADADNQGSEDTANKQDTIEKIPNYASAAELGIFVGKDHEKMPRLSNQADVDNAEDSDNFGLARRARDGSEDVINCDNANSSARAYQATNSENTTSMQAVVDQLHHSNEVEALTSRLATKNSKGNQDMPQGKGQQVDPAKMQEFREQLYEIVSKWHPEKTEKLVGMFLELDYKDLKDLAGDTALLKEKVQEALLVLEMSQAGSPQNKESSDTVKRELLGDQVYEMVAKLYPDHADKVTGMLLEMNVQNVLVLVEKEELLSEKAQEAYSVLSGIAEEVCPKHQPPFDLEKKGDELYKAVEKLHPDCADKITGMLLEMDWKNLNDLLKIPDLLKEKIEEAFIVLENSLDVSKGEKNEEQSIGEQLYAAVENLRSDNADKITGMLLEMPTEDLKVLMKNHKLLEEKIVQSLEALTEDEGSVFPEKDSLGEQLYNIIAKDFPEKAELITGMLLEMDPGCIVKLLQNPKLLQEKVHLALNVLSESE